MSEGLGNGLFGSRQIVDFVGLSKKRLNSIWSPFPNDRDDDSSRSDGNGSSVPCTLRAESSWVLALDDIRAQRAHKLRTIRIGISFLQTLLHGDEQLVCHGPMVYTHPHH